VVARPRSWAAAVLLLAACGGPSDRAAEALGEFRIVPVRPVAELRAVALAATPPPTDSGALPPDRWIAPHDQAPCLGLYAI